MGTLQVPGRLSGRTYTVNIKGDTPSATEQERIRRLVGERETKFVQRYESTMGKPLAEPDDGTAVGRGLERGKAGAKSVLGTTVETVGEQLGIAGLADYGRSMEEAAAKRQLDLSLLQPPATTRQDVAAAEGFFPTIGKSLTYAGELAGEQIPQLGVGLAGGAAGAVAGGLAAGPPGALAGFGVGSGLVEAPMLFGANVQRQEEEVAAGRKKAVDLTDALTATVGQAALTSAANALAGAGVFLRPGAKLFTRAVSGAGVGATTESLNEVGQQLLERYQAGLPVDSPDAIQEYIDAGIAGGVLGGGAGGIGGAVGGSRPVEPAVTPPAAAAPPAPALPAPPTAEALPVPPTVEEAVVPPTVEEAVVPPTVVAPTAEEAVAAPTVEEAVAPKVKTVVTPRPPRSSDSDDFDMAERFAEEDRATKAEYARIAAAGPTQKDLFAGPTGVETPAKEVEAVATPVEAPAKAVEPAVLTNDLVTQLGIRNAKAAPLRVLVGTPLTDENVIRALNSWAQNPRATPEQKALAVSLSTGQPITPAEPADVTETAKAQPKAVGDGVVDRAQGMGSVGGTGSGPKAATRAETLAKGGLEPDMPVPSGAAASEREQPAPLIEEEQLNLFETLPTTPAPRAPVRSVEQIMRDTEPSTEQQLSLDFTPPYDAGTGAARQLIPGARTTVDPSTLQAVGKPRMERGEVYAPIKQGPAKVSRDIQEQAALADLVRAYVARTTPEYRNQTGIGGGINSKTKFTEVKEWTTLEDKLVVLGLLESTPTSPQEKAAKLYFSKTIRPSDALDMMIDDLTIDYQLYNNTIRSTGARSADPDFELKKGTGSGPAALALEWIRDGNLDDATVHRLNFKIALDAQATQNLKERSKIDTVEKDRAAGDRAKENALLDAYLSEYLEPGSPDALRAEKLIAQRANAAERLRDEADLAKLAKTKTKNTKAKARRLAAADREVSSFKKALLRVNPLAALDQRLHYSVLAALERGDLKGALQALSVTTSNPQVAALATRFAALVPNTKVMLAASDDPLLEVAGSGSLGVYYPRGFGGDDPILMKIRDTILLNRNGGLTVQILLHEVAHAATSHVLNTMPNHPFVRQMTELFEYTRDEFQRGLGKVEGFSIDPEDFHYGLKNVKEFVAELLGRVSFGADVNGMRGLLESLPYPTVLVGAKDKKRNAWDKFRENFANFIRSVFGRPSVQLPQENALDLATRLADGLLALSPNVVASTALADASVSPMKARNMLNGAILNASVWDSAGREKLSDMMQASAPPEARRFLLGLLQLDWFNDLAGKYFKEIGELKVVDDLRRGDLGRLVETAKPVHTDLQNYATKQPDMFTTLASTQGRATLEEVDPTVPVSTYGADQDKVRVWHELNRELDRDTTGEMRNLFKTVRNMMAAYRDEIKAVLVERVKDLTDDVAMQNQLVSRLMAKLDEGKAIDPYFSLMRKGDFWLSFTAEDTTAEPILVDPATGTTKRPITQYVQAFESVWEREQFKVKLAAAKDADGNDAAWNVEEFMRPVTYVRGQTVPSAFVQGAINIVTGMVQPGATKAQQDQVDAAISAIQDMFVRFTPENSIMKSFTQRKGTRGFIGDITMFGVVDTPLDIANALAKKTSSLAYQLANMKYGAKIQKLRNRATATERTLNESPTLTAGEKAAMQAYRAEFDDRAAFAQSPNVSKNAQITRGVTFGMTLGFNIAGAANNLMQIIMVGIPELAGRYGSSAALRELGSASRLLLNAGKTYKVMSYGPDGKVLRELSSVDNFGSLGNYYEVNEKGNYVLRTDKKIPAALRAKLANMDVLVEVLSVHGMLSNSMAQEMLETEAGWGQKINKWSGFLMHHGERYNRQAVAIAAYNLELGKVEGPISDEAKRAAAMKAVGITERVNGSIGAATAPRHALGSVGSVVFMFKRFGLHMARYIINTANQALRGKDKVERDIARYQITGILGTTALFAGVQGLPFFGELMSLINLIFTEDDEEPAEVLLQKYLQEPFYHGALNYLTGAEFASRISMSGLIFRENKIEKDQSVLYDLIETLGGPAVGVFMNTERGINLLSQGETYRGIEAMMPSVIKSAMKAARYGTEGATTLRRDEIVPLSNMEIAMQFLGYTPGAYARTQEQVSGQKRIDEAVRSKRNALLRKYYLAYLEGDFEEVRSVINETREFSLKHPEAQITGTTLSKSLNSNLQRSKEMVGGVSYTPNYRPRAVQELSEFDEDTSLWAS